ncbi:succinate dehydrogenase, cytochrome b556 subunit [soil metagenome]
MSSSNDPTGINVTQPNGRPRPLSPHLQVWRWHVTMTASILHRITGGALYFGVLVVSAWVLAVAFGPYALEDFGQIAASPLGLIVWFGLSLCLFYHLLSGIRHLIWDTGEGLAPKAASSLSSLAIYGSIVLTVLFWIALFVTGKVSL